MTIPETVGGNGVKFTGVAPTVGEDVDGGRVVEEWITVEVGSEDSVARVVGDNALALKHATNPSTSKAPIKNSRITLLILSPDYLPAYGSAASRRPSPKKLKPSTAMTMNAIGARIQAFWPRVCISWVFLIIRPQLISGSVMPIPRKLRKDSARITP